jgi:small GTP-binding protein
MTTPQNSNSYGFKIVIIGAKGVGKTCLFNRYCFNSFNINTQETIGINFHSSNLSLQTYDQNGLEEENYVTNSIFDLAGHERFKPLIPKFIEGSSGALLVFDSVDPTSIKELDYWYDAIMNHAGDTKIPILLVGSKSDLIEESNFKTVTEETIQQVIRKKKLNGFYRTSSLGNYNVLEVFRELSELMLRQHKENLAVI